MTCAACHSARLIWVPAHVGIFSNQMVDAVAKAFLYDTPKEPELIVLRTLVVHEVVKRPGAGGMAEGASAVLADRKPFRLIRRLSAATEARRLRDGEAAAAAAARGEAEEAAANAARSSSDWLGRWPILDGERMGERRLRGRC